MTREHTFMGTKVGQQIGGDVYVSQLEGEGGWRLYDLRVNWMSYNLPVDESDLPEDYDGGRWSLQAEKHGYEL